MSSKARKFIRHPSDIPIEVEVEQGQEQHDLLNNVSSGGLSFQSRVALVEGALISLRIPAVQPPFVTRARVMWCRPVGGVWDVGVELLDPEQVYSVRMVEQICHIEHYKREIRQKEGRTLSGEQAAREWIERYAEAFPAVEEDKSA